MPSKDTWFVSKYVVLDNYFASIDPRKAWLLGLLAADGNVHGNTLTLAQSGDSGRRTIEEVKRDLNYSGPIYCAKTSRKDSYSIAITSKELVSSLKRFNIGERKSLTYKYPGLLPKRMLRYFTRGYIDGDGCIGIYTNSRATCPSTYLLISFVGTRAFVEKINKLLPIEGNVYQIKRANNCWEIRWNGQKAVLFGTWLYAGVPLYNSVKKEKFDYFINNFSPAYMRFIPLKRSAKLLKSKGFTGYRIAKELKIEQRTVYKWIHKGEV